jgi:hypothetical protein
MSAETMNYEAMLAFFEAKRAAAEKVIAGIKELRGLEKGDVPANVLSSETVVESGFIPKGAFLGLTIGDAAKKFLAIKHEAQTTAQICEGLKQGGFHSTAENFLATAYSALAREEHSSGDVIKVKRGLWALKEWHPGLRRVRAANGKDTEEVTPTVKSLCANMPRSRRVRPARGPLATKGTKTAGEEIVEDTVAVLKEAGTSLHVSKIAEGLKAHGRTIGTLPLSAQLAKSTKWEEAPLRIVKRGVFGLSEPRKTGNAEKASA